jgi:hypothetical protein
MNSCTFIQHRFWAGSSTNAATCQCFNVVRKPNIDFKISISPVNTSTMRYFQLALLCFICVAKTHGQTLGTRMYSGVIVEITKEKKPKKIYTKVEITTPFPGGDSSWVQSLEDSLNRAIPVKRKPKAGKYIVSIRFLIERDGSVFDIQCLKDPGFGMYEQVKAVIIKKFSRRWGPQMAPPGKVRQYHTSSTTPQVSN